MDEISFMLNVPLFLWFLCFQSICSFMACLFRLCIVMFNLCLLSTVHLLSFVRNWRGSMPQQKRRLNCQSSFGKQGKRKLKYSLSQTRPLCSQLWYPSFAVECGPTDSPGFVGRILRVVLGDLGIFSMNPPVVDVAVESTLIKSVVVIVGSTSRTRPISPFVSRFALESVFAKGSPRTATVSGTWWNSEWRFSWEGLVLVSDRSFVEGKLPTLPAYKSPFQPCK